MRHRRLRLVCGSVLTGLAILLAPLAVVAVWVDSVITDTDRYVATVAPIPRDPVVRQELTVRLTEWITEGAGNEEVTSALATTLRRNGAPPSVVEQARALSDQDQARIAEVVRGVVERAVTTEGFAGVWEDANRRAHTAVVQALTGEGGSAVAIRDGTVTLDVGTLLDAARKELADAGFDVPPTTGLDRSIVLVEADRLDAAQRLTRLLDDVGGRLPVLVAALAALAVWTTPARRRTLTVLGTGVALMMASLLVALDRLRSAYLDSVPAESRTRRAAAVFHDSLFHPLQDTTRTTLLAATALVAVCCLRAAVARRSRTPRRPSARGAAPVSRTRPPVARAASGPAAVAVAVAAVVLTGLLALTRTAPGPGTAPPGTRLAGHAQGEVQRPGDGPPARPPSRR
ncbi:hypothetical protein [Streptomyces pactum]|uniref:hypothetical protein n=1 Tax=Streptomyces pactum TaxID=68249 RepID=UPI0036F7BF71